MKYVQWITYISVTLAMISIIIGVFFGVFGYLGSIKSNTEQIPNMATDISGMKSHTEQIPDMASDMARLLGRSDALITVNEGGQLNSLDGRVRLTTQPDDVIQDAILKYIPASAQMQPADFPPRVTSTGYGFVFLPYSLSDVQLPESPFTEAEVTIIYADADLQLAGGKPQNLMILSWNEKQGEWEKLETIVVGRQLRATINEPTLLALVAYTPSE